MPMLGSSPDTPRVSSADGSKAIPGKTNHPQRPRGKFAMTPDPVFYQISPAKTGRPVQKMSYKPLKTGFCYFRESPVKPSRDCSERSWATKTRPLARFPVGGNAIRCLPGEGGTWDGGFRFRNPATTPEICRKYPQIGEIQISGSSPRRPSLGASEMF